jgi:hypothetical protein
MIRFRMPVLLLKHAAFADNASMVERAEQNGKGGKKPFGLLYCRRGWANNTKMRA